MTEEGIGKMDECRFCGDGDPIYPTSCDVPDMDVYMWMMGVLEIGERERRYKELVVENNYGETAVFIPRFCPMCGRELLAEEKRTPPDSWEQLEKDANKSPFSYCEATGLELYTFDDAEKKKSLDIIRRAKALAENGM